MTAPDLDANLVDFQGRSHGPLMLIGYARVSTQDQNLDLQVDSLTKAGYQRVFADKISGTRANRPGLDKALDRLREGDTLVVGKLDRLGRSVKQLVGLITCIHQPEMQFWRLMDSIDTGTPSGRFFFHVMASLPEMEKELTIKRMRIFHVALHDSTALANKVL
jgi:DNA invertase Pin-like site-specific DNA recombinase